jgi:AP-2 complex subunit mu-1
VTTLGSTTFFHVKHENVYLVCVTKSNTNAALVFEFLYRVIAICKSYFGKVNEESIKSNFVLIYELVDGECKTKRPCVELIEDACAV